MISVVLDSGPLGLLVHELNLEQTDECWRWMQSVLAAGIEVGIPEIVDFEVRRELLRLNKRKSIMRLDSLVLYPGIVAMPINSRVMRLSAELWAYARSQGRPSADPKALDADVILAATVQVYANGDHRDDCVVATTNAAHLELHVNAATWQSIRP